MGQYHKYGLLTTVRLTQLAETINQLKTIKYPTAQIKELIDKLQWIQKDFGRTIDLLNKENERLLLEPYNKKKFQLHIEFY